MILLEGVTRTFAAPAGDFAAVREVSFNVAPGRLVSLVGPSGCGKSTLLGMIGALSLRDRLLELADPREA